ncbi:hypothetical protein N781_18060 [Pontibacillus halophilus JSM 076056 = DSM 19796]|uniref:GerMN domain-containing protein n=1 Tax=Pontibacillus halophilus JSM 076056 = DSM 19796 TaxID=1385510 RepID=A0A0A5GGB1_9BACI|nr:GerMN domain-containing protein [Pontibacillus halophilus]KGX92291.1 hypothetical protein N781_18060 [Pontibacillus halophilus JSM 076056 = DSM 19796]
MTKRTEQEIEKYLQEMPLVEDTRSKEEVYRRVQEANEPQKKSSSLNKLLPVGAIVLAIGLLFFMINQTNFGPSEQQESSFSSPSTEQADRTDDAAESEALEEASPESGSQDTQTKDEPSRGITGDEDALDERSESSSFINQPQRDFLVVPYKEPTGDILVPISYVSEQIKPLQVLVNELQGQVKPIGPLAPVEWIREASFSFDGDVAVVSIQDGKQQNTDRFLQELELMLIPAGIETVQLQNRSVPPDEGVLEQYILQSERTSSYKRYETDSNSYLVPVYNDYESLEEALFDMKQGERKDGLEPTFPETYSIESVSVDKDEATITLSSEDEWTEEMITAMLATAHSFGMSGVQIDGIEEHDVGKYDVTKPISLPVSINDQTE